MTFYSYSRIISDIDIFQDRAATPEVNAISGIITDTDILKIRAGIIAATNAIIGIIRYGQIL